MSLLFRTRTPAKSRRKSTPNGMRTTPIPMPALGSAPTPVFAPVRHAPRRRGHRASGYATHRPPQPMFRVT